MKETMQPGFFWHLGKGVYTHRVKIVIGFVVLLAGLAWFASQTPQRLTDNGFTPYGSESQLGLERLQTNLDYPGTMLQLVYESEQIDLSDPNARQRMMDSLAPLQEWPAYAGASFIEMGDDAAQSDPPASSRLAAIQVMLEWDTDEALRHYPELREQIKAPAGMQVYVTGGTPVMHDMQEASKQDIIKAEMLGIPIAIIVLLLVFGTVVAAALPLLVGLVSVTLTLGLLYFVAGVYSLSNFMPNIVTMLGLAVGIDYALFIVSRFREERSKRSSVENAVAATMQTAGKSIFFSGVAVWIGLLGMLFIDLNLYYSLCLGGVTVVFISVIVANTLLPAVLGLLGDRINAWPILPKHKSVKSVRISGTAEQADTMAQSDLADLKPKRISWQRWARFVMRYPVMLTILIMGVLVSAMFPLRAIVMDVPSAEVLPPKYESRLGYDLLHASFPAQAIHPVQVVVHASNPLEDERTLQEVRRLQESLSQMAGIEQVTSFLDVLGAASLEDQVQKMKLPEVKQMLFEQKLAGEQTAVFLIASAYETGTRENRALIEELRELDAPSLELYVTGEAAFRLDIIERITKAVPYVLLCVTGVTFVILMLAFRSLLLPLKAVLMNLLSLGASLGVVVLVFQDGWLASMLDISATGYVNATLPVIIFCVVFGISMDYEVFLISRIMEEYERTGDNDWSTAEGLHKTGRLITSAALILIVVVGTFIFTDIEIMKALGLGLSLAVFIDATLIRIVLVPSLMKLLGKANWWAPAWLKPIRSREDQRTSPS
ncbi:MMPL family transporter [Marinicrinis sediminis]|uniref:MMPL family transporter n=1 Tax=Marinicrinis sediminis TaxID=1652465 RepID=A0ABW5R9Y8_9BACL